MDNGRAKLSIERGSKRSRRIVIDGIRLEVTGRWLKIARLEGENWVEDRSDAEYTTIVRNLKTTGAEADIFTFSQKIPRVKPRFRYPLRWDNIAAIPLTTYEDWLGSVSTDMRKDLKRAASRGVMTKVVQLDDELVEAVIRIHDETPSRQGKAFRHFGKDFNTVKREYSSFPERSDFFAAYHGTELIGIIKVVHVGALACIMQILSKIAHYDKRPTNALIAKTVEVCIQRGSSYLTYGQLLYNKQIKSSLADFKIRNGFERINFPRYYVPLTLKGKIGVWFRLYEGIQVIIPKFMYSFLVNLRKAIRGADVFSRRFHGSKQ